MSLATKLQLKQGQRVYVGNAPGGLDLGVATTDDPAEDAVLVFVRDARELETLGDDLVRAAAEDRLAWIAYPKGRQLGTDLNRDVIWKLTEPKGVRPVRNVSIDDVWSALRFRPA